MLLFSLLLSASFSSSASAVDSSTTGDVSTNTSTKVAAVGGSLLSPIVIIAQADAGTGTVQESCAVDGVGWLICPIGTFLSKVTDGAYTAAKQLLFFEVTNPFSTDPKLNPIYALWSAVRNVANVAFVIAFFAVIFSQATSIGISAYGIRKMLPRIIAAAILVNLSYYLCIFAIDISNIVGSGLGGLIGSLPKAAPPATQVSSNWETLLSNLLVGGAAFGLTAAAALWATGTVFAFLAASLLAIIVAVAIFMARTVLLIMLTILSPLAFVAYILPNTESLFDKWRKTFVSMLVMFPLVSILFAGSEVASQIMRSTAAQAGGGLSWLYELFALGVLAIPLFGIPWIVKFSGGFIGRVAGMVNDRSKGAIDRARNKGNQMAESNRARSTKWGEHAGRDKDGIALSGTRNRFKRGIGRATAFGTGYSERSKRKQAKRESEINRIHNESYMDRLNEKEENEQGQMVYTSRAQKLAKRSAGPGGEAGMLRVQQSAFQEHIKHLGEERAQASLAMEANGMYGKGTYFEYGDDGKIVASHNNTGLALAALAQGKKVGVIAAGVQAFNEDGSVNMGKLQTFDGSASATSNAAKERIAKTGDGAAFGYVMHGGEDASAVEITTDASGKVKRGATKAHKVKALEDKNYDDFMQFVGDNAGASIGKVPHLFKADDAFTGVNAEQIADWHGTELRSAASRIVQLREKAAEAAASGNVDAQKTYSDKADKHEKAMIQAWNAFQQDPQLAGKRSEKKEADFQSALDIIQTGTSARKALREYGDSTDGSGALVTRYAVGGKTSTVEPVIFASKQPGGTAAPNVEVRANEEVTQGGLIVPHGTTRGAAASAAASNPGPAPSPVTPAPVGTPTAPTPSASPAPAPSSSGPAPAPSAPEPTSQERRESGGNFGGFRYEPPQQTPPSSPAASQSQGGGSFDSSGRFTPNRPDGTPMSPDEADEYHRRFGGGN